MSSTAFRCDALVPTRIPLHSAAGRVVVETLNGQEGGARAFVAVVAFRDARGMLLLPPYPGFDHVPGGLGRFPVAGGTAARPAVTGHAFVAPDGARSLEIELRRGECGERPVVSRAPAVEAPALSQHMAYPSQGARIRDRIAPRVTGIFGAALGLGDGAGALPYDRYDAGWQDADRAHPVPSHLVIEVEELSRRFGWEHALTLRDPPATVELAAMLRKARAAGIVTVLVPPAEGHRFPLLSRLLPLFDLTLREGQSLDGAGG